MKNISWLVIVLAIFGTACGAQWTGNYTGTWQGTANSTPFVATTLAMTLYQSGSSVNGYWLAQGGNSTVGGQIQGTTSGNTLTAALTVPTGTVSVLPGAGTFSGSLTLNSNTLTGSISGTSNSAPVTASLSLTQSR
jgi:hypothetical protein